MAGFSLQLESVSIFEICQVLNIEKIYTWAGEMFSGGNLLCKLDNLSLTSGVHINVEGEIELHK